LRAGAASTGGDPVRSPRAWPALTLLTGIALLTGFAAGRRRNQTRPPHTGAPAGTGDGQAPRPEPRADLVAQLPPGSHTHRLRPDVLLGPVLLVMIGVIVDRLRESAARESVTAWMLTIGATVAALLARSAGYPWAARGFYCFLVGFSWAAAALYVQAGLGAVPSAWVSSTLTASLLWFAVDLRHELRRAAPGHKVRAALVAGEHWLGFFVAWAVLAQLIYLYVSQTLATPGPQPGWAWPSIAVVTVLGSAAILALTVRWPRRRQAAAPAALPTRQSAPASG
jgi:hypothetical protein